MVAAKRILVIEDDPAVRGLIVDTIRLKGWQPLEASDGEMGVRTAETELPDLILCDIQMPKMDGYGVLHCLRENKLTAALPFIFLSGLGEKPKVRKGMESGADDYIVKPFTVQELIGAIEARLQKQAAFRVAHCHVGRALDRGARRHIHQLSSVPRNTTGRHN